MKKIKTTRVQINGSVHQSTIPAAIVSILELDTNSRLDWYLDGKKIVIKKEA